MSDSFNDFMGFNFVFGHPKKKHQLPKQQKPATNNANEEKQQPKAKGKT